MESIADILQAAWIRVARLVSVTGPRLGGTPITSRGNAHGNFSLDVHQAGRTKSQPPSMRCLSASVELFLTHHIAGVQPPLSCEQMTVIYIVQIVRSWHHKDRAHVEGHRYSPEHQELLQNRTVLARHQRRCRLVDTLLATSFPPLQPGGRS